MNRIMPPQSPFQSALIGRFGQVKMLNIMNLEGKIQKVGNHRLKGYERVSIECTELSEKSEDSSEGLT